MADRFPRPTRPPTREEKIACIERELGFRRRVYERRVDLGQMQADRAGKELWAMEAILQDYQNSTDGRLL